MPKSITAILTGISEYNNKDWKNLNSPNANVEELYKVLINLKIDILLPKSKNSNPKKLNYSEFNENLIQFNNSNQSEHKSDTALFYFAGHGIQTEKDYYLIPSDSFKFNKRTSISLKTIIEEYLSEFNNKIIIIDACRTFDKESESSPRFDYENTFIALSTSFGKPAKDSLDENTCTIYTKKLIEVLTSNPSLEIKEIFQKVKDGVELETKGNQSPSMFPNLSGEFYFQAPEKEVSTEVESKDIQSENNHSFSRTEKVFNIQFDTNPEIKKSELRKILVEKYNEEEFKILCSDLSEEMKERGINLDLRLESLGGKTFQNNIQNLIELFSRKNLYNDLIQFFKERNDIKS